MDDPRNLRNRNLLSLHVQVLKELQCRRIVRTANNITGDLAEFLFCNAYDWEQQDNSKKGYDAVDRAGTKFQIKARRLHEGNTSRLLSVIRTPDAFDVLAAMLFDEEYGVRRAALIPQKTVLERAIYNRRQNGYRFLLVDDIWNLPEVKDATTKLTTFEKSFARRKSGAATSRPRAGRR